MLVRREVGGFSYAEIAEQLELSVPSVQMLLFRARRALRAELEPQPARRGLGNVVSGPLPAWLQNALGSSGGSLERFGLLPRAAGLVGAAVLGTVFAVGSGALPLPGKAAEEPGYSTPVASGPSSEGAPVGVARPAKQRAGSQQAVLAPPTRSAARGVVSGRMPAKSWPRVAVTLPIAAADPQPPRTGAEGGSSPTPPDPSPSAPAAPAPAPAPAPQPDLPPAAPPIVSVPVPAVPVLPSAPPLPVPLPPPPIAIPPVPPPPALPPPPPLPLPPPPPLP